MRPGRSSLVALTLAALLAAAGSQPGAVASTGDGTRGARVGAGVGAGAGQGAARTVTGTVRSLVVDPAPDHAASPPRTSSRTASARTATGTSAPQRSGLIVRSFVHGPDALVDLPEPLAARVDPGDVVTVTTTASGDVASSLVAKVPAPGRAATGQPSSGSAGGGSDGSGSDGSGSAGSGSAGSGSAGSDGPAPATVSSTVAPTVQGRHRLTVLPVYWDSPDPDAPHSTLTALAAATAEYWSQQSGGRITVVPTVREWTWIADPGSCSSAALATAALRAHDLPAPVAASDHVIVYFPYREDCGGWAGLGEIDGSLIWDNGYPLVDVTAHEFGHNLGLGHANAATCDVGGVRVTLSPSCEVQGYRDYADIMGIASDAPSGNLNTALADSLGLARVVTAERGRTTSVDLAPLSQVDAVRAVRIRLDAAWLYLDYRPATGRDVRVPGWGGVQAHLLPDAVTPESWLLDGQPSDAFASMAFPPGTTWPVPGSGLGVTVTSVGPAGAHVEVAPAGPAAPVLRAPAAGTTVGAATTVGWRTLSPVRSVDLAVDGRRLSTVTVDATSGTLAIKGLSQGRHEVTVRARDAADGRTSPWSAPLRLFTDLLPPSRPAGLSLAANQTLTWRASVDAGSGVAGYLLSRDGGRATRLTRTFAATSTPVGRHTWWVAAVDRLGNVSPATGLVVVRAAGTSRARSTHVLVRAGRPQ